MVWVVSDGLVSGGGARMPEVGNSNAQQSAGRPPGMCSLGISGDTGEGVGAGLEEESTCGLGRSERREEGSSQRTSCICFRERER